MSVGVKHNCSWLCQLDEMRAGCSVYKASTMVIWRCSTIPWARHVPVIYAELSREIFTLVNIPRQITTRARMFDVCGAEVYMRSVKH